MNCNGFCDLLERNNFTVYLLVVQTDVFGHARDAGVAFAYIIEFAIGYMNVVDIGLVFKSVDDDAILALL